MNLLMNYLKAYALSWILILGLGFLVKPLDAWSKFGASSEGQHLLLIHLLQLVATSAQVAFCLATLIVTLGAWERRRTSAAPLAASAASSS